MASSHDVFELEARSLDRNNERINEGISEATRRDEGSLPPLDSGKSAMFALLSCCIIQIPIWGKQCHH